MLKLLLSLAGLLLLILLCTEEFRNTLPGLWRRLRALPGGQYLAYPLAVALILAATGLILFSLWFFVSTTFSYD